MVLNIKNIIKLGAKIMSREERKLKFETLQLHVGQENQIQQQMQEQYQYIRQHLMFSKIVHMQQQDLD